MSENTITLYPSNWLYNAGVIGLLNIFDALNEDVSKFFDDKYNGAIQLTISKSKDEIFSTWVELSPKSNKGRSIVYGYKGALYANQTEKSIKNRIKNLVTPSISKSGSKDVYVCGFCNSKFSSNQKDLSVLNQGFGNILSASEKTFPNMFWNNEPKYFICKKCEFIITCHHLGLTKLSDNSEIFINAPSFKVMFELNKIVKEIYGSSNSEEARSKREILATSVIEYSRKLQSTIGLWSGMNIEIITKSKQGIDFFSLPYDTIKIISDRKIASALSDLGEIRILNNILDKNYSQLIDISYKLIRIGLKDYKDRSKNENDIVHDLLFRDINRKNISKAANKILMLYSLIEEKLRRS